MNAALAYVRSERERLLGDLFDLLRIPSISALPEHASDVRRAVEWAAERARAAGLEQVEVLETGGHPVAYGEWLHAAGAPTVLLYGHVDVQPVDPLEGWTSPPFEPSLRDGRVYARGASDMKGNVVLLLGALEAHLRGVGHLPVNVKLLLEGQEEIGSPQIPAFLERERERLACDLAISADSTQWDERTPALLLGARGGAGVQIDVTGANSDLHSGLYGGAVANPLHALARIVDAMHDADGTIAVEGFYDDVRPLGPAERAALARVPHDDAALIDELAVTELYGESGYSTLERLWARPTLEVTGMWGGFQGEGHKSVLPREAHVKIICRLVPDQDPTRIVDLIEEHVHAHTPPGVRVSIVRRAIAGSRPYRIDGAHPANGAARDVLREVYGVEPLETRFGATVPVLAMFQEQLGVETLSFGFTLLDERLHAPDEFWRLSSFDRGLDAYVLLLERLGAAH